MENRLETLRAEFAPLLPPLPMQTSDQDQPTFSQSDLLRATLQDEPALLAIATERTGVSGIPTVRLLAEHFGVSAALVSRIEQELTEKKLINLPAARIGLNGNHYDNSKFKGNVPPRLEKPLAKLCAQFGAQRVAIAAIEACEAEALAAVLEAVERKRQLE